MLLPLLFGYLPALKFVSNNWAVTDCSLSVIGMSLLSGMGFYITLFSKEEPGFTTSYTRSTCRATGGKNG